MDKPHTPENAVEVDRVQTGVRIGKRLLKVLKAVAELKHISLGDLLEGIVLHGFEGKCAFSAQTLKNIDQFRSPLSWPHFGSYGRKMRSSEQLEIAARLAHEQKQRRRTALRILEQRAPDKERSLSPK